MPDDELIIVGKRKVIWEPAPVVVELVPPPAEVIEQPDIVAVQSNGTTIVAEGKRTYKKRTGNGHVSEKKIDLDDAQRNALKIGLFLPKNGQIENDDCVIFRNGSLSLKELAIFQVTGYISVLHTQVAEGRLTINNLIAYEQWMSIKYGGTLWARYNHPLYVKAREMNATLIAQGHEPTAKVKGKKKKAVANAMTSSGPVFTNEPLVSEVKLSDISSPGMKINLVPKFTPFRKRYAGA